MKNIIEAAATTAKAMARVLAYITHLKNEATTNHDLASSRFFEQKRTQEAQREADIDVLNDVIKNFAINGATVSNQAVDIRNPQSAWRTTRHMEAILRGRKWGR